MCFLRNTIQDRSHKNLNILLDSSGHFRVWFLLQRCLDTKLQLSMLLLVIISNLECFNILIWSLFFLVKCQNVFFLKYAAWSYTSDSIIIFTFKIDLQFFKITNKCPLFLALTCNYFFLFVLRAVMVDLLETECPNCLWCHHLVPLLTSKHAYGPSVCCYLMVGWLGLPPLF